MDLIIKSQDALLIIIIPLMVITARAVRANWKSLWDNNLTNEDRRILLQASLFLLEPMVVFCHELGHVAAIKMSGGGIAEFHFAFLSGYVVPSGSFTDLQLLWIYLSGNLVEIIIGYLLLAAALFVSAPAVVATLVYLGLWSVASCAVMYALMSLLGLYGDWSNIYSSPLHGAVAVIGVCHAIVIASIAYMLHSEKSQLWFAIKTRPTWAQQYLEWKAETERAPTAENFVHLAWLYYEASLYKAAKRALDESLIIDPDNPQAFYLYGWLVQGHLNLDKAEEYFMKVVNSSRASAQDKARAYMGIAVARLNRASRAAAHPIDPQTAKVDALQAYAAACAADPELADPRFHCAVLLNDLQRYADAIKELDGLAGLNWLDSGLRKQVTEQMQIARTKKPAKK
ncbi:MAG TPA: hypothetical protein V6C81_09285 [Planktothrix sp.]|jgi:hypothetical protein